MDTASVKQQLQAATKQACDELDWHTNHSVNESLATLQSLAGYVGSKDDTIKGMGDAIKEHIDCLARWCQDQRVEYLHEPLSRYEQELLQRVERLENADQGRDGE